MPEDVDYVPGEIPEEYAEKVERARQLKDTDPVESIRLSRETAHEVLREKMKIKPDLLSNELKRLKEVKKVPDKLLQSFDSFVDGMESAFSWKHVKDPADKKDMTTTDRKERSGPFDGDDWWLLPDLTFWTLLVGMDAAREANVQDAFDPTALPEPELLTEAADAQLGMLEMVLKTVFDVL